MFCLVHAASLLMGDFHRFRFSPFLKQELLLCMYIFFFLLAGGGLGDSVRGGGEDQPRGASAVRQGRVQVRERERKEYGMCTVGSN